MLVFLEELNLQIPIFYILLYYYILGYILFACFNNSKKSD